MTAYTTNHPSFDLFFDYKEEKDRDLLTSYENKEGFMRKTDLSLCGNSCCLSEGFIATGEEEKQFYLDRLGYRIETALYIGILDSVITDGGYFYLMIDTFDGVAEKDRCHPSLVTMIETREHHLLRRSLEKQFDTLKDTISHF